MRYFTWLFACHLMVESDLTVTSCIAFRISDTHKDLCIKYKPFLMCLLIVKYAVQHCSFISLLPYQHLSYDPLPERKSTIILRRNPLSVFCFHSGAVLCLFFRGQTYTLSAGEIFWKCITVCFPLFFRKWWDLHTSCWTNQEKKLNIAWKMLLTPI